MIPLETMVINTKTIKPTVIKKRGKKFSIIIYLSAKLKVLLGISKFA